MESQNLLLLGYSTRRELNSQFFCYMNQHDEQHTCFYIPDDIDIKYFLALQRKQQVVESSLQQQFPDTFICTEGSKVVIKDIATKYLTSIKFYVDYTYEDLSESYCHYNCHPVQCKPFISDHFVLLHENTSINEKQFSDDLSRQLYSTFLPLSEASLTKRVHNDYRNNCHSDLRQKVSLQFTFSDESIKEFDWVLKFYDFYY